MGTSGLGSPELLGGAGGPFPLRTVELHWKRRVREYLFKSNVPGKGGVGVSQWNLSRKEVPMGSRRGGAGLMAGAELVQDQPIGRQKKGREAVIHKAGVIVGRNSSRSDKSESSRRG